MGFRARKSFKVMPGVRVTVSKSGLSASAGIPGARISKSTSGRTTRTVGIPGTGVYYRSSSTAGAARAPSPSTQPVVAPAAFQKPGLTAPRWEKELHRAVLGGQPGELPRIAQTYPEATTIAATLDGIFLMQAGHQDRALEVLRWAWSLGGAIEDHPFAVKYLGASQITLEIATGVSAVMPLTRDTVGLALAELEQAAGQVERAIYVVEQLDPSSITAVSLCELYLDTHRFADVVDTTNGIMNVDDPTALLMAFRGSALRELGHFTAAREAFKEALKSKARDASIRHLALVGRARCYLAESKPSMARKDLERVLAEDSHYPEVQELLAGL